MTPEDLIEELRTSNRTLRPCDCGSAVQMLYEPGCTRIVCHAEQKTVAAIPDWNPAELAKRWNDKEEARDE